MSLGLLSHNFDLQVRNPGWRHTCFTLTPSKEVPTDETRACRLSVPQVSTSVKVIGILRAKNIQTTAIDVAQCGVVCNVVHDLRLFGINVIL